MRTRQNPPPPADVTLDAGRQTVRLHFAVGENQAPLCAGVDDIPFESIQ